MGEVSLQWLSRRHRQGEIGFVVHPGHQGRGLAAEAAEVVLGLGFDGLAGAGGLGHVLAVHGPSSPTRGGRHRADGPRP